MTEQRPVALVTGASRGIGRGIVIELARNGCDLAGVARTLDTGILEVKQQVEDLGARLHPIQADVSSFSDHQRIVDGVLEEFGRIDVLVNNAGVAPEKRLDILETTEA